jgi:hypothetical protein
MRTADAKEEAQVAHGGKRRTGQDKTRPAREARRTHTKVPIGDFRRLISITGTSIIVYINLQHLIHSYITISHLIIHRFRFNYFIICYVNNKFEKKIKYDT